MRFSIHAVVLASSILTGCVAEADPSGDELLDETESELATSDFEHRGLVDKDGCAHTAGRRARKFLTFFFHAKEGDRLDISTEGYSSPDLRILTDAGKQIQRGKKRFEGDGDSGGFVSEAFFVAPKSARYRIAIRDTTVEPGESVPSWVRPVVMIDDRATKKRPTACPAQP